MNRTKTQTTILIVLGSVVAATIIFSFSRGASMADKFLFTADVSNVTENRNFFGRLDDLSFLLSNYPYSLEGIIELYGKIAEENGWQINSGKDFNFNEKSHTIETGKNGQRLLIDLERLGGADKILIKITHDR